MKRRGVNPRRLWAGFSSTRQGKESRHGHINSASISRNTRLG